MVENLNSVASRISKKKKKVGGAILASHVSAKGLSEHIKNSSNSTKPKQAD
jgi:hypothetical protein